MKRLLFLWIALLVVPSFGNFYFDLTLGGALRHPAALTKFRSLFAVGAQ